MTGVFELDFSDRFEKILDNVNSWRKRHLLIINILAPVYFFCFVLGRVYIETALMAPNPFFSYYTACHHMLWFYGTFLSIVLTIHLVLKIPFKDLIILAYGVTLTGLPLIYGAASGQDLQLTYLRGSVWEILTHVSTFVWTYEADRALTGELIVIFTGITGLSWLLSRSFKRGLASGIASYAVLMVWAVHWVGREPHKYAVFGINTWMTENCLLAVFFLNVTSALTFAAAWRSGVFSKGGGSWLAAAVAGLGGWAAFSWWARASGWLILPFDWITAGLPVFTDVFLLTAFFLKSRSRVSKLGLWVFLAVLAVQIAVMGPLLLRREKGLVTPAERHNQIRRSRVLEDCAPFPQIFFHEKPELGNGLKWFDMNLR